jgi:hypothetical protein
MLLNFVRFVNVGEIQGNFSPIVKSYSKEANGKIYFMSCLHIWKQKVCLIQLDSFRSEGWRMTDMTS